LAQLFISFILCFFCTVIFWQDFDLASLHSESSQCIKFVDTFDGHHWLRTKHETFGTKIYIAPCEKIINSLNTKALSLYQYVCPNKLSLSKVPLILLLIVKLLQPMLQMSQIFGFCREKRLSSISFFTYFNDVHVM
jgi:hypothetical protein